MLYNMLSYAMLYNMLCCVTFILRYKTYNVYVMLYLLYNMLCYVCYITRCLCYVMFYNMSCYVTCCYVI